jgi:hypothetical protein
MSLPKNLKQYGQMFTPTGITKAAAAAAAFPKKFTPKTRRNRSRRTRRQSKSKSRR